jgi:hypothetical protein
MKNILKHTLPQCLSSLALVSLLASGALAPQKAYAQEGQPFDGGLTAVSVKKFINETSDFNIHGISVNTAIKAANSDKLIESERRLTGKSSTFHERLESIKSGLSALQDEPLPVNPGSIQLQSFSGLSGNFVQAGSCIVHLDPSASESYSKYASIAQGFDFDERLMKKMMAHHELSHCMYYGKRSAHNGTISDNELVHYFDKLTTAEKQTLKTFFLPMVFWSVPTSKSMKLTLIHI